MANADPQEIFSQSSYYPLGNYIADLIERRFGKSRLIDCVGEPIQFLETYNEAARLEKREKANTFVFSGTLMDTLKQIRNDL